MSRVFQSPTANPPYKSTCGFIAMRDSLYVPAATRMAYRFLGEAPATEASALAIVLCFSLGPTWSTWAYGFRSTLLACGPTCSIGGIAVDAAADQGKNIPTKPHTRRNERLAVIMIAVS